MTSPPDLESRLPVGSSASMISGRLAIARAIATRWRSPPESSGGQCETRWPRPTRSSAPAPPRAARCRRPGVEHPVGDVVQGTHRLLEVEALEHEAHPVGAQAGQLRVGGPGELMAGDADVPPVGRSSVPMIVSIVVLPDPDGPTDGDPLAIGHLHAHLVERHDPAGVVLCLPTSSFPAHGLRARRVIPGSRSHAGLGRSPDPRSGRRPPRTARW